MSSSNGFFSLVLSWYDVVLSSSFSPNCCWLVTLLMTHSAVLNQTQRSERPVCQLTPNQNALKHVKWATETFAVYFCVSPKHSGAVDLSLDRRPSATIVLASTPSICSPTPICSCCKKEFYYKAPTSLNAKFRFLYQSCVNV